MSKQELQKQSFSTNLSNYQNTYMELMERDFSIHGIEFDSYARECVVAAMNAIYEVATSAKAELSKLEQSSVKMALSQVASLKLNANAFPREVYFTLRRKQSANKQWIQIVELGIEGGGFDTMLRQYGVDVEQVYPTWIVKDGDDFTYPKHIGIEATPPTWRENGMSLKAMRVVVPVKLKDGSVQYLISERESVQTNLFAHIRNNLMNETFGICKDRYNATDEQKAQIAEKKEEIYEELRKCETVDEMLKCKVVKPYISMAWLDSPEGMIVRKMKNNAVKKFPKSLNSLGRRSIVEMDEVYRETQEQIENRANKVDFIELSEEDATVLEVDEEEAFR